LLAPASNRHAIKRSIAGGQARKLGDNATVHRRAATPRTTASATPACPATRAATTPTTTAPWTSDVSSLTGMLCNVCGPPQPTQANSASAGWGEPQPAPCYLRNDWSARTGRSTTRSGRTPIAPAASSTSSSRSASTPSRHGSRRAGSSTSTCTPTTCSPSMTARSPGSSTGRCVRGRSPLRPRGLRVRPRRSRPADLGPGQTARRAAHTAGVRRAQGARVHGLGDPPPPRGRTPAAGPSRALLDRYGA